MRPFRFQSAPGPLARGNVVAEEDGSSAKPVGFNPPPARWPGETPAPCRQRAAPTVRCFNPPPARWPGETRGCRKLPRRRGRGLFQSAPGPMARGNADLAGCSILARRRFNPPPGPLARGNGSVQRWASGRPHPGFNPPPARRPRGTPGAIHRSTVWPGGYIGFNPPPARRPGETTNPGNALSASTSGFNLPSRPKAGELPCWQVDHRRFFRSSKIPGSWPE